MSDEAGIVLIARVGRRITSLRRIKGWTQETFAERLGVSVQWVSRAEVGENLTLFTLAKLALVLEVDPIQLLTDEPEHRGARSKRGRPRG